MKSKFIQVEETEISRNQCISRISCSKDVRKYFQSIFFRVQYDVDVKNVSASILQIPAISSIIAVAWVVGADVYVKELDRSYLESLSKIKSVMKKWYPKLTFSTDIHVKNIVSNKFSNPHYGLLFGGGLDSTASYIRHKNRKPNLITVWGADIPIDREWFWTKVRNKHRHFAQQEDVKINFVKTNLRQFLNEEALNTDFGRYLFFFSSFFFWWTGFHQWALSSLCAPLTVVNRIGTLLHPASHTQEFKHPSGSDPLIDNNLSWGDVKVVHDGYALSRQEKIRYTLKRYIRKHKRYPTLRVCHAQYRGVNCSKCEKCCRTIVGLVLESIDPNKCGFNMDNNFFHLLRRRFIYGRRKFIRSENEFSMWNDIKRHIPESLSHNLHNSKEFFRWFRHFDLSRKAVKNKMSLQWCLTYFYYKLPRHARNAIAKLKHAPPEYVL